VCLWLVSEGNERGTLHKSADKKKSAPRSDTEEIATIRALCAEWMTVERSMAGFGKEQSRD